MKGVIHRINCWCDGHAVKREEKRGKGCGVIRMDNRCFLYWCLSKNYILVTSKMDFVGNCKNFFSQILTFQFSEIELYVQPNSNHTPAVAFMRHKIEQYQSAAVEFRAGGGRCWLAISKTLLSSCLFRPNRSPTLLRTSTILRMRSCRGVETIMAGGRIINACIPYHHIQTSFLRFTHA